MKVTINSEIVEKQGLKMQDFLVLLAIKTSKYPSFISDSISFLKDNNLIISDKMISSSGIDIVEKVLINSSSIIERDTDVLVDKLQALWPAGYKDGKYRWKSNKTDIKKKLQKFFKNYGQYTDDQIIEAAKRYVKKFDDSGDRKYQKLLKYFIFKEDGSDSDLANNLESIIENEDSSDDSNSYSETLF